MKTNTVLAVILIAIGVIAFAYQGFTYTTREKVLDVGPVHVTKERTNTIPLPPIVGIVAVAGGVILLLAGRNKA